MKLLLIEKSSLLNQRLANLLIDIDGIELLETAATIEEAVRVMQLIRPGIVVMDIHLPDECAAGMLASVRGECPAACIIVLSYDFSEVHRKHWLRAGADNCFDIVFQIDQWLDAVTQQVIAHTSGIMPTIESGASNSKTDTGVQGLTPLKISGGGMARYGTTRNAESSVNLISGEMRACLQD